MAREKNRWAIILFEMDVLLCESVCVDCCFLEMRGEMQKQVDLALQKLFESKSDAFTTKEIRNFVQGW